MKTLDERIMKAEGERKDAIEHGDRKGRWYAEGKIDALKAIRIEQTVASGAQSDREVAIGEHAFGAGYNVGQQDADDKRFDLVKRWSEYTPPEFD